MRSRDSSLILGKAVTSANGSPSGTGQMQCALGSDGDGAVDADRAQLERLFLSLA